MPRFKKYRECRFFDKKRVFRPIGCCHGNLDEIVVRLDEFEAMRLCDNEGKNQIEAGEIMGVSRATIQRLLNSGRKKISDAIIENKILIVENKL